MLHGHHKLNARRARARDKQRYDVWRAQAEAMREQAMRQFQGQYVDLDPLPPKNQKPTEWRN